jgi:CBS domain-containing protein
MTVQTILKIKGDAIFTASPTQTLAQVAQLLSEKGIGAVVVTGIDKNVLGILSERDIVRAIAKGGAGVLDESVARHMTSKVVTSTMSTSIAKVMELMTVGKFRHVPIVEGGTLIGIVSIGDVVKKRLADIELESHALKQYIAMA